MPKKLILLPGIALQENCVPMYFLSASVVFGLLANNQIDLVNLQPVSAESHQRISDSHQIARRDQRERCGIVVHKLDVQIRRDEKRTILLIRMAMYVTE
jgi:hypothetical protein